MMTPEPPPYLALTVYGVPIPKHLQDREAVAKWTQEHGPTFPGSRVVRNTPNGPRTVWRWAPTVEPDDIEDALAARTLEGIAA